MDDAHEDAVLDRRVTSDSFDYALHEAKLRTYTAIGLSVASLVGILLCLFLLDPPESLVGAGLFGIGSVAPTVNAFLGKAMKEQSSNPPNATTAE
jgi:hypothetical protein